MFWCIILFYYLCVASAKVEIPDDLQEYINDLHDNCLKANGLTEEDHKKYDIKNKDPNIMCYMQCLMMESKWMNENEDIQYGFILQTVHPAVKPILEPALAKCHDLPEKTVRCETAYNFNVCLYHADPENWFFL